MKAQPKEGLKLLTEEVRQLVDKNLTNLVQEILTRNGKDNYGIDVAHDTALQTLIMKICIGFIPVFAQQAWSQMHAPDQRQDAVYGVVLYSNSAYQQLFTHFEKSPQCMQNSNIRENAYNLTGSIIRRTMKAFNQALYKYDATLNRRTVAVYVPASALIDPDRYRTARYTIEKKSSYFSRE